MPTCNATANGNANARLRRGKPSSDPTHGNAPFFPDARIGPRGMPVQPIANPSTRPCYSAHRGADDERADGTGQRTYPGTRDERAYGYDERAYPSTRYVPVPSTSPSADTRRLHSTTMEGRIGTTRTPS